MTYLANEVVGVPKPESENLAVVVDVSVGEEGPKLPSELELGGVNGVVEEILITY